jgi:hypothetical protein
MLSFVALALLTYLPHGLMSPSIRQMFYGIICPAYWMQGGDVLTENRAIVSSNPNVVLEIRTIFCNDVFNNWLLLLTFGLCSPVLAVAIACAVLLKIGLWVLLIGRFTRCILDDDDEDATTSPASTSRVSNVNSDTVHFALTALAEVYIPLHEVLTASFWRLMWCSALFVAFLSWDMATDEVGWLKSLWVPLVPLGYVIVLRCVAYLYNYDRDSKLDSAEKGVSHREEGSDVSQSPLHVDSLCL